MGMYHRTIAKAAEETGRTDVAIGAYRTLVAMKPNDPAIVHFRLARLLAAKGDSAAKRQVLMALEEAPRYRDAHRLLLEITRSEVESKSAETDNPTQNTQPAESDTAPVPEPPAEPVTSRKEPGE